MPDTKLTLQVEGEREALVFEKKAPRDLKFGESWRLRFSDPDAMILLREGSSATGYFGGSLATISLGEAFGYLLSGIRTGRLYVNSGAARRTITLRDGQVIFAWSNQKHERLGSAVMRLGMMTYEEVEEASAEVKPGARLGLVLTRSERLTAQQLYSAMTYLVREIVLNLFELTDGEFLFVEEDPPTVDALKLPEHTKDVVLEGIRRAEEVHRLRRRWPLTLLAQRGEGELPDPFIPVGFPAHLQLLRECFDGSNHEFLTLIDELMRTGVLLEKAVEEAPAKVSEPARESVFELYQMLISEITASLTEAGMDLGTLRAYLLEPGAKFKEAFDGVTLGSDGAMDLERLQANLTDWGEALGRARAYEALDAFVSYALFSAQNVLAAEEFARLQEASKAMRGGA